MGVNALWSAVATTFPQNNEKKKIQTPESADSAGGQRGPERLPPGGGGPIAEWIIVKMEVIRVYYSLRKRV